MNRWAVNVTSSEKVSVKDDVCPDVPLTPSGQDPVTASLVSSGSGPRPVAQAYLRYSGLLWFRAARNAVRNIHYHSTYADKTIVRSDEAGMPSGLPAFLFYTHGGLI